MVAEHHPSAAIGKVTQTISIESVEIRLISYTVTGKVVVITGALSVLGEASADVAQNVRKFYDAVAIPAASFANTVAFAVSQPEDVDINEILFRPTRQDT